MWDKQQYLHGTQGEKEVGKLTICVDVLLYELELLREVHHHVVSLVIKQSRKGTVNNLGRHGRVGTNVGQEQRSSKGGVLFLDFCTKFPS